MKLLRKTSQVDNETLKSNLANNNLDTKTEETSNASQQFQFVYSPVLSIQKAWRSYRDSRHITNSRVTPEPDFQSYHSFNNPANKLQQHYQSATALGTDTFHSQNVTNNNNLDYFGHEMSNDSRERNKNTGGSFLSLHSFKTKQGMDYTTSGTSNVSEQLKENQGRVGVTQDLDPKSSCVRVPIQRSQDEDEADFQKRLRKLNLLSLAHEFAALKKMNSEALPFNLHQDRYRDTSSISDTASETEEVPSDGSSRSDPASMRLSSADVSNGNSLIVEPNAIPISHCSIPDVVRATADEVEHSKKVCIKNPFAEKGDCEDDNIGTVITIVKEDCRIPEDNMYINWKPQMNDGHGDTQWHQVGNREEIRKKLALHADEEFDSAEHVTGLCYVNEAANDMDNVRNKCDGITSARPDIIPLSRSLTEKLSSVHENEDFFTKQARLQTEAKMALAQVRPMAHMQLQLEKQKVTKSALADIVGMPGYVDGVSTKLTPFMMNHMNIAQLQVVVNDLHARIESLNDELMQQLVMRDDLHMAQDSMLVDIEDLTGRAQEFATRVNKKRESNKYI